MAELINDSELIERARRAVLKRGGTVTVGDIMSETGLGNEEAKNALRSLIQTHEGTMRVSESGEITYVFAPGCILRDQRTWWERNKKAVMGFIKGLFKVIIMLVLVTYFVIYLLILLALLSNNRGRNSGNGIGWAFYFFWGRGSSDTSSFAEKEPLYKRVYNFVFGPEEEEVDPLEARSQCAQLIRAKHGVIVVEDWMMISGQSRAKCESDLARYTAEFDGTAEITENGTLVYVFSDMMKSTSKRDKTAMPDPAWMNLEPKKLLSGNRTGNGAVIGLNLFNIIMSFLCLYGGSAYLESLENDPEIMIRSTHQLSQAKDFFYWLGIFPFIFSCLIFLVPLIRLPLTIKENKERRERNIYRAALANLSTNTDLSAYSGSGSITMSGAQAVINKQLRNSEFDLPSEDEVIDVMGELCDELEGDVKSVGMQSAYTFDAMELRQKDAAHERQTRHLDKQDLGRVVYSSDYQEQEKLDETNHTSDLDDFDRALEAGSYSGPYSSQSSASRSRSIY